MRGTKPKSSPALSWLWGGVLLSAVLLGACAPGDEAPEPEAPLQAAEAARATDDGATDDGATRPPVACDPDDGGLTLPDGLCALVVADDLGPLRHLTVRGDGAIFAALRQVTDGGGVVALRDGDGDGRVTPGEEDGAEDGPEGDRIERFGDTGGTGIHWVADPEGGEGGGHLWASTDREVRRWSLPAGRLIPEGEPRVMVSGFPDQSTHAAKAIAFDGSGNLYVNVGAPSNACQEASRTPGSPGVDPCPQRERQAGLWRFAADRPGQNQQQDGERYAAGIRNVVAMAWDPATDGLYAVQHGRDQLHTLWPDLFTAEENAELPAEELLAVSEGDDYGWPYCYWDHRGSGDGEPEQGQAQGRRVLAPEYGGDGQEVGRCADFDRPVAAFPGHWAPNDLLFYTGDLLPERYRSGAFIAFHGSWNRAPLPQRGYNVVFVPMDGDGRPSGDWEVFAEGFTGVPPGELSNPKDAEHRPMGLAQGPDGSLYVADSVDGTIWRILPEGGSP